MEREVTVKEFAEQGVLSMRFKTSLAAIGDSIGGAYGAIFGLMGKPVRNLRARRSCCTTTKS